MGLDLMSRMQLTLLNWRCNMKDEEVKSNIANMIVLSLAIILIIACVFDVFKKEKKEIDNQQAIEHLKSAMIAYGHYELL